MYQVQAFINSPVGLKKQLKVDEINGQADIPGKTDAYQGKTHLDYL